MAIVKGIKEKVHLPLYDSITIRPEEQFGRTQSSNVLRFFQDVTGKNKLQTNMQAASLLPHWNTFEARAMRVVISDLPAQFPDKPTVSLEFQARVTQPNGEELPGVSDPHVAQLVNLNSFTLHHFVSFKRQVEGPGGGPVKLNQDHLDALELKLSFNGQPVILAAGEEITIDRAVLKDAELKFEQNGAVVPRPEQIFPHDGSGDLIGKFIYNTVTTFFVGEKIMIQMPTWFFPAGAGPYSEDGRVTTHGYPSPQATFRFAEPINIDTQQNFRVEVEIPESEVLNDLRRLYGPLFIWVVVDGYMTRDVQ